MKTDKNKGITNITYNYLNLSLEIAFGNGNKIQYVYDAAGTRLQKKVMPGGGTVVTTDFLDGFQYQNTVLGFFHHPEGYVMNQAGIYKYVFQYKDHLGNVRLSYTDTNGDGVIRTESEIVQENNYYPFGLEHKGYNDFGGTSGNFSAQKYKYNGKEYNDAFGLNIYEMDWRQYDPAISRWTVMDPVTHHDFSPYSAFDNNPAFWSDPSGANSVKYNWGSRKYDVVDHDGKWVRSFDPGMLGNYLPAIAESINLFFSLNPNDDENSGGGNGDGNGGGLKTKLAKSLVNVYKSNHTKQMAYSLLMNTLLETTKIGDLSRKAREEFIKTYGTVSAQKNSDVYGLMIDVLKEIKNQNKGNKYLSDAYIYRMSAKLGLKATGLEIENQILERHIKTLDINLYYMHINPSAAPKEGGFSGGGAGGGPW